MRLKSRLALLAVGALAATFPAAASASLVFVRKPEHPVVYIAQDNGSGARKLAAGADPRITPNGADVVYLRVRNATSYTQEMMVVPASGGTPRKLARNWRAPYVFAFSPDSSEIVTVVGPEVGVDSLVAINLESGAQRKLASGYFSSVSFAPNGEEVVYARSGSESYPAKSDVYRVAVSGGTPVALTHDHRSLSPVSSSSGEIAFVEQIEGNRRKYGPKNEIYLMNDDGGEVHRLTHTNVAALLQGLTPLQFSSNGQRLLAEFGGEDTSYAVTVNPQTGAQHRPLSGNAGYGFIATALSADGSTILGTTGGFEPSRNHNIVTVPYSGGRATVLERNAYEPAWNG